MHNFNRVSSLHDNGTMPPQMQNGDQTVETTAPENAIYDNVTDIDTIYPLQSTDTDVNGPINRKVLDHSRFGTTLLRLNIVPSNTARV